MIKISDSCFNDIKTFNVLGIDPGTDTIGFSILKVSIDDLTIEEANPWTEKVSRFIDEESFEVEVHSAKFSRLNKISEKLLTILDTFRPALVFSEAPFFNRLRPNAYAPLIETVFTIQKTLHSWDNFKPLYMIDPSSVKIAVGARARSDKIEVKQAIIKIPELTKLINFDKLDEHSIDATAVAYCGLLRKRR